MGQRTVKQTPSVGLMQVMPEGVSYEEFATFGAVGSLSNFTAGFQDRYPNCLLGYAVGTMDNVYVFHLRFDKRLCSFKDLAMHYFTFHDATTRDLLEMTTEHAKRPQRKSAIFFHSDE